MNYKKLAETIEGYMNEPADGFNGHYALKGWLDDRMKLEVGKAARPLVQMNLDPEPEIEDIGHTYLDEIDKFDFTPYKLTEHEYRHIEDLLSKLA